MEQSRSTLQSNFEIVALDVPSNHHPRHEYKNALHKSTSWGDPRLLHRGYGVLGRTIGRHYNQRGFEQWMYLEVTAWVLSDKIRSTSNAVIQLQPLNVSLLNQLNLQRRGSMILVQRCLVPRDELQRGRRCLRYGQTCFLICTASISALVYNTPRGSGVWAAVLNCR